MPKCIKSIKVNARCWRDRRCWYVRDDAGNYAEHWSNAVTKNTSRCILWSWKLRENCLMKSSLAIEVSRGLDMKGHPPKLTVWIPQDGWISDHCMDCYSDIESELKCRTKFLSINQTCRTSLWRKTLICRNGMITIGWGESLSNVLEIRWVLLFSQSLSLPALNTGISFAKRKFGKLSPIIDPLQRSSRASGLAIWCWGETSKCGRSWIHDHEDWRSFLTWPLTVCYWG